MKFIFPQNYRFQSKLFGLLDYSTIIFDLIFCILIYFILSLFFTQLKLKIFLLIVICFPVILLSIVGFNRENILAVLKYLFRYYQKPKIYLYEKTFSSNYHLLIDKLEK